ncbi:bile acid:sodium symporter family protein [Verrucomicrobia bacterium]|jgi:BASS family bile acid:Na+ symporter|nr:bile acid:sodium symporter family protein [Verrucomicrobiota bacterium]NCG27474.1 bile acid:sodium symporter family protein [Verrucomicrobiales bacterium]|tara:strand:- start:1570 stop:2424 length:855 start_codon:yes stop_codon:yes gene_type:complete
MIVKVLLPLILAFIMFSLGLGLKGSDFSRVLKFPVAFGAGLFNQVVFLPLIALGLAYAFGLSDVFAVGLMILALCPGGVTSNILAKIAGGNAPLSISLTAVTSLLSIFTVPLILAFSVNHFMGEAAKPVDVTRLGLTMFLITAVPVAVGMALAAKSPALVDKIAPGVSGTAVGLFVIIIVAALAKNWEVFSSNLGTLGPVAILLNVVMLVLGLVSAKLLRLDDRDATTISIESGVQNGTLAIAVGSIIAVVEGEVLPPETVPAAVYSITMYFVCVPFVFWRRNR